MLRVRSEMNWAMADHMRVRALREACMLFFLGWRPTDVDG